MEIDFRNIQYLAKGSIVQKRIHGLFSSLGIFDDLEKYDPVLVGTFPLGINIEGSDLDILMHCDELIILTKRLVHLYGSLDGFYIEIKKKYDKDVLICRFNFQGFPFEIYATDIPVEKQRAYLHMIKEYKILNHQGESFKNQVIALKKKGVKTEPAFAQLLGVEGDPYEGLLAYEVG